MIESLTRPGTLARWQTGRVWDPPLVAFSTRRIQCQVRILLCRSQIRVSGRSLCRREHTSAHLVTRGATVSFPMPVHGWGHLLPCLGILDSGSQLQVQTFVAIFAKTLCNNKILLKYSTTCIFAGARLVMDKIALSHFWETLAPMTSLTVSKPLKSVWRRYLMVSMMTCKTSNKFLPCWSQKIYGSA